MRLRTTALRHLLWGTLSLVFPTMAGAQPATDAPDAGAPEDPQWSELQSSEEPDEPATDPAPAEVAPAAGSPYVRAAPAPPAQSAPSPARSAAAEQASSADESSSAVGWMRRWRPQFANRSVRIDYDLWSTDAATTMTWDVVARLGVEDVPVYFDVDMPWAYLTASGGDQAVFGNPTVGLHGGDKIGKVVGVWGGAVVAIPTLFGADPVELGTTLAASQVRAGIEMHRFTPEYVPLRALTGVEVQIHPLLYARAELDPTFYIPTKDASARADAAGVDAFYVAFDQIYEVEALSPVGFGGGVRLQAALLLTDHASDRAQTALEPYLTYSPPPEGPNAVPVFARLGLLVALDPPLGFGFNRGKLATVRTSIGVSY